MKYSDEILIKSHPSYNGKNWCTICYFKGFTEFIVKSMLIFIIMNLLLSLIDNNNFSYLIISLSLIYIVYNSYDYKKWKKECNNYFNNKEVEL